MNHCILRRNFIILACVFLKVFEKGVLRKIFWPKGTDVIGLQKTAHRGAARLVLTEYYAIKLRRMR